MTGRWWEGRMLGFDLETTGVDPETDRIVTAACAWVGGGIEPDVRRWLVNPGIDIPAEATAVHGITTEHATAHGQPPRTVIGAVAAHLHTAVADSVPVVIMNAPFDLTMLEREARRWQIGSLVGPYDGMHVVDPRVLDKHIDRYRRGGRRLEDLCATYGVAHDGAHDAAGDAVAACRVAWRIGSRSSFFGELPLPDLHALQVRLHAEQARSLAGYFRSKGQYTDADGVRVEWPLVPYREAS